MVKEKISLREKKALLTRQAISEAGVSLLSRKGYYNVTVDEICEKAGVSKGTFYNYYKSKDEIIWYEYMKLDQYYKDAVAEEMAKKKHAKERLHVFCIAAVTYVSNLGVSNVKTAYQSQLGPDKGFSPISSEERPISIIVRQTIEQGQQKGELRKDISVDEMTRTFVTCLRGTVFEWCLTNGKYDLVTEAKRTCSMLIEGMLNK